EHSLHCAKTAEKLVLPHRIELWTSPLPRECSTTELRQLGVGRPEAAGRRKRAVEYTVRAAIGKDSPILGELRSRVTGVLPRRLAKPSGFAGRRASSPVPLEPQGGARGTGSALDCASHAP